MKKFRKMIAGALAAVMCAVSMTPFISNAAVYSFERTMTPYTVSFTIKDEKYSLWQEASDYWKYDEKTLDLLSYAEGNKKVTCYDVKVNVYTSEETPSWLFGACCYFYRCEDGKIYERIKTGDLILHGYELENENDRKTLESYLTDNNIPYTVTGNWLKPQFDKGTTYYDEMNVYMDIKEDTGFMCVWSVLQSPVSITDIENALPEKTLDGDANVDGKVDIADAAAIFQHIGNPAKYALTIQGEANADCYNTGDGITGMDAIAIQKLEAGLIESFDEA